MSEFELLREGELEAFVAEGVVVLDRPLTWEMVGQLLDALDPGDPPAAD
jgi:hypothetical protein